MKRKTFLIATALIACMFGIGMMTMPKMVSETFGLSPLSLVTDFLLRFIGSLLFGVGVANFLVRKDNNIEAVKTVLMMNITYHILSTGVDITANINGVLPVLNSIPAYIVHIFVGVGSFIFLPKGVSK